MAQNDPWLVYANQSAIRNQPLHPRLVEALSFLPQLGVKMKVFSGGQPSKGSRRTGSHRHDEGLAADVFFIKDGKVLDWANPRDRPVFEQIVRLAKARGVTGFGAGEGYMRPGSMHIGFGAPAVWGRGGSGKNAPAWLRAAFENREPPPMVTTPSPAPVDTVQTAATTPNIPANALAMAASADVEPAQATAPVAAVRPELGSPIRQAPENRNALGPIIVHTPNPDWVTRYQQPAQAPANALSLPQRTPQELANFFANSPLPPGGVALGPIIRVS